MPIYEFECNSCGRRFEELAPIGAGVSLRKCPDCGEEVKQLLSPISPPGRLPRGAKVRDSEARRSEREAARKDRLAETAKFRARGEIPPPRSPAKRG